MKRRRWLILGATLALILTLYFGSDRLLPLPARWLDVGDRPRRADYVLVLGGDAGTRAVAAAMLVRRKYASTVLVPRTVDCRAPDQMVLPPEHELIRRVLVRCGVAEHAIRYLGGKVDSTYDEVFALAKVLDEAPDKRVLVVTNGYHSRRARWILSRALGAKASQAMVVSAPVEGYTAENWWRSEEGFQAVVGEFAKMAIYGLCYGYLLHGLALGLVVIITVQVARRRRSRSQMTPADSAGNLREGRIQENG
ncbi:MAG: YdcF family protein [Thermoguttaceae bacterium]|jgi:uncharacterized SAM-binding protein YcdF (DUF218 family)